MEMRSETNREGPQLEIVEGIQISGEGAPAFRHAYEFLSALGEEIQLMKRRILSGDPVALGYADVLTRAMR